MSLGRTLAAGLLALALATRAEAAARITLDARNADLADVIRLVALQSGRNVVADGSIKPQRVTLRLRDVDVDTALATLAQAYGLQMHREGSVLLIGDAAAMNRRYPDTATPGSPRTEVFTLARAKPDEVVTTLLAALPVGTIAVADKRTASLVVTGSATTLERARQLVAALDVPAYGAGSASGSERVPLRNARPSDVVKALHGTIPDSALVADDRANAVIVTGSAELVATARGLLGALDVPGKQVQFEVRVADVTPVNENSNVGIEFGGTGFGSSALGQIPYTLTRSALAIDAQVNALVQSGHAQILATPRITTLNNKEASLLVGEEYPVVTVNQQTGYPSVETIDVGVRLRLTPTIGDDGAITAELHPEYSEILGFNSSFPIIANRRVDATLRVADGETIVLGGLFEELSSETVTKVPFLADIPGLGVFFRNKERSHSRDEVVFFITPHVL